MFRGTDAELRIAMMQAAEERRELGHELLGPDHLLLGLLANVRGSAYGVLDEHGVSYESARVLVAAQHDDGGDSESSNADDSTLEEDREALRAIGIDLDAVRAAVRETFGEDITDRWGERRGRRRPGADGRRGRGDRDGREHEHGADRRRRRRGDRDEHRHGPDGHGRGPHHRRRGPRPGLVEEDAAELGFVGPRAHGPIPHEGPFGPGGFGPAGPGGPGGPGGRGGPGDPGDPAGRGGRGRRGPRSRRLPQATPGLRAVMSRLREEAWDDVADPRDRRRGPRISAVALLAALLNSDDPAVEAVLRSADDPAALRAAVAELTGRAATG